MCATRLWFGCVLCALLVTAGSSGAALAQELPTLETGPLPANDCVDGEIYDDGTAENGYSATPEVVENYEIQQLFNPDGMLVTPTTVCVLLTRNAGADDLDFEIVAYDGTAEGGPTTELGSIAVSVTGIPQIPEDKWYVIDITALTPEREDPVFLGMRWDPAQFPGRFVGADESVPTVRHPSFERFLPAFGEWSSTSQRGNYRAMMIRTEFEDDTPPPQITLVAEGYWVQGIHTVDLSWSGATSDAVDVLRNGELVMTVPNDGFHTDSTGVRGRGIYRYQVCEAGTAECSNEATVRFGGPPRG